MYTLLIISLASFFGMFYMLTKQKEAFVHLKEHSVSSEKLAEVNKSLVRNFLRVVVELTLLTVSGILKTVVSFLTQTQKVTETKLRETARKISHAGHGYGAKNPNGISSGFLKDLARHKKLVAKRDK